MLALVLEPKDTDCDNLFGHFQVLETFAGHAVPCPHPLHVRVCVRAYVQPRDARVAEEITRQAAALGYGACPIDINMTTDLDILTCAGFLLLALHYEFLLRVILKSTQFCDFMQFTNRIRGRPSR